MTVPDDAVAEAPARPGRRPHVYAAVLLVIAAAALWGAGQMTWATVYAEDGQSEPRTLAVTGMDWSPWLIAAAVALLAGAAAQFVLHGGWLRIVAVLVAVIGATTAIPAISLLNSENDLYAARAIDLPARYDVVAVTTSAFGAVVVLVAAVCAVAGAVFLLRAASAGRRMSTKYASPAARRDDLERRVFAEREQQEAASEREFWDALDHGLDPTADRDQQDGGDADRKA